MQDRYAGDIGDFGKFALLKAIQEQGLAVGVNWYKVEDLASEKKADGSYKNRDGEIQIPPILRSCDGKLADVLTNISGRPDRSIAALEKADLIPGAIYYSDAVTVPERGEWHHRALQELKGADIIFLDPDNGLLVKSVGPKSAKSVKYVFYKEVWEYLEHKKSVLIYNHRCRKPEKEYFDDIFEKLKENRIVKANNILAISYHKGTVRDYIAVAASKEHFKAIKKAFAYMEQGAWGKQGAFRIPAL